MDPQPTFALIAELALALAGFGSCARSVHTTAATDSNSQGETIPLIREYRPSDLDDVLGTWEAASAVAHRFLAEEFLRQERHNISNLYLPNAETWVWEVEGAVVGFIALIKNEVGAIFVHPSYHGSGIGRALMDKARALRGNLEVEVFERNAIGRAFYDRYGFVLLNKHVHEPTGQAVLRLALRA